jgi:hypothetical protein
MRGLQDTEIMKSSVLECRRLTKLTFESVQYYKIRFESIVKVVRTRHDAIAHLARVYVRWVSSILDVTCIEQRQPSVS